MRCALARRRRARQVSPRLETQVMEAFRLDMQDGALVVAAFSDVDLTLAYHLMDEVGTVQLRTLDALHLAVARHIAATGFATADKNQAEAARRLGLDFHRFDA